jgi:hypothetical protein
MTELSERAVIAVLHLGAWTGMAVDREVTEETAEHYKADTKDAGTYTKRLFAKQFLDPIAKQARLATNTHKILTLPWEDGGVRILANTGYTHYTEQMRLRRLSYMAIAKEIVTPENVEKAKREAKARLANMYNDDDYPSPADILEKFYFDAEIKGVPEAGDFRAKLSDATVKAITKDIERRADERLEKAMNSVFERILKVTGHMVDSLKEYTPATGRGKGEKGNDFKGSTVYNIQELADVLPALNLTNDKRLIDLQKQLVEQLVEHSPEILKSNPLIRNATAQKAEKIHNKVKSFLA